jgi:hypothetical protein
MDLFVLLPQCRSYVVSRLFLFTVFQRPSPKIPVCLVFKIDQPNGHEAHC